MLMSRDIIRNTLILDALIYHYIIYNVLHILSIMCQLYKSK